MKRKRKTTENMIFWLAYPTAKLISNLHFTWLIIIGGTNNISTRWFLNVRYEHTLILIHYWTHYICNVLVFVYVNEEFSGLRNTVRAPLLVFLQPWTHLKIHLECMQTPLDNLERKSIFLIRTTEWKTHHLSRGL